MWCKVARAYVAQVDLRLAVLQPLALETVMTGVSSVPDTLASDSVLVVVFAFCQDSDVVILFAQHYSLSVPLLGSSVCQISAL